MEDSSAPGNSRQQLALRLAGAALLVATGAIHLDLYLTGYRHIPKIGPAFLLQVITAFALAAAVLLIRRPLVAAAGAGFAVSTLGGYLLALSVSLFGFQEVRTKQPGPYPFFCQVHHFMTGMMVVGHSSANAAAVAAFRAAIRAHPPSYCGRQHAMATAVAARRAPAGRLASGD